MSNSRNVGLVVLNDEDLSEEEKEIVLKASLPPEDADQEAVPSSSSVELGPMDQKKAPRRVRVQRTFRLYPELLEALSMASTQRKQAGYEQWSQDAIINHALKLWLDQNSKSWPI